MENRILISYPSIDKPWLKYYNNGYFDELSVDCSMVDYLYQNNSENLHNTALNYFGNKISFEKMFDYINKIASSLYSLGVRKGEIISVCSLNTPETVCLLYAINKAGAVCNMIGITSPVKDIHEQLITTECKKVFVIEMGYEKIVEASGNSEVSSIITMPLEYSMPVVLRMIVGKKQKHIQGNLIMWKDFLNKASGNPQYPAIHGEDPALIEYTGGSTGIPKGCSLLNENMNAYYANFKMSNSNGLTLYSKGDSFLAIVPLFLAFGASTCCHGALCHSMELILSPDPSPEAFKKIVLKRKPSHIVAGRTMIDGIANSRKKTDLSFICSICYGGEGIDKEWEKRVQNLLQPKGLNAFIRNGYGMTETSAGVLIEPYWKSGVKGGLLPLGNVEVMITDPDDCNVEYGYDTDGELCISSNTVMGCYYKKERETAEVIFEKDGKRWLKTHDLARITHDGYIIITGRIKRIYHKCGSDNIIVRVYPMRIEEVILKEAGVVKCAAIGVQDEKTIYRTVVFVLVENRDDAEEIQNNIESRCRHELPESHLPDEYVFLEEFPYTRAGKVDYMALEKSYGFRIIRCQR